MADPWANITDLTAQGRKLTAITPSDTVDLTDVPKALLVTAAGNISIDAVDGPATAVVVAVTAGQVFDAVRVKRVRATSTTATVYAIG